MARRSAAGMLAAVLLAAAGYVANDLLVMIAAAAVAALSTVPAPPEPRVALQSAPTGRAGRIQAGTFILGIAIALSIMAAWISATDSTAAIANYLWLAALVLCVIAAAVHDAVPTPRWHRPSRRVFLEMSAVAAITFAAFGLRIWNLADLPPILHGDEGEMGVIARDILTGRAPPLFAASPFFSLPYVLNYLQAGSFAVFGADEFGLRMLSVLVGTACVPLLYLIGRSGWGTAGGLSAAWLMAVAHIEIHYSRLGFVFIESVFCMLLMMTLLVRAGERHVRAGGWLAYALAGLSMGLGQYFYFASRVMPIVAAPILLYLLFARRASLKQVGVLAVAAIIAFAPLAAYFVTHLDVFIDRVSYVSIFRDENIAHVLGRPGTLQADWPLVFAAQFDQNLRLFLRSGDAGGFYFQNIPGFDPLMSILFWIGLGIAASRFLRLPDFALMCWFALGLFFGGVLTIDAPSAQRLTVMLPAVCLFGALCAAEFWRAITASGAAPAARRILAGSAAMCMMGAAAFIAYLNVDMYFRQYANGAQGREAITIARIASAEPLTTQMVLFGMPVLYSNHGAIRFIAPGVKFLDLKTAADFSPATGRDTLVLAVPERQNDLHAIEARYPGVRREMFDPLGRLFLISYRITPP